MQDLVEEVRLLHDRLHRIAVGLALSEDLLAATLEQFASMHGRDSSRYRMQANRARIAADECRAFAKRLDELNPDGKSTGSSWDNPFPDEAKKRSR